MQPPVDVLVLIVHGFFQNKHEGFEILIFDAKYKVAIAYKVKGSAKFGIGFRLLLNHLECFAECFF